eukprot:c45669_g1_i1 orf=70-231(-)
MQIKLSMKASCNIYIKGMKATSKEEKGKFSPFLRLFFYRAPPVPVFFICTPPH